MTTKTQKIFAKFIRTKNPNERKIFGRKLKGVKTSDVSYTKDGKRYTIHGNIPWTHPNDKKPKPKPKPKPVQKHRRQKTASEPKPKRRQKTARREQHFDAEADSRKERWRPLKTKPKPRRRTFGEFLRWQSDNEARSTIKRRNRGEF